MNPNKIKLLTIRFKNEIYPNEIQMFRGAVIRAVGKDETQLYHNHDGVKLRYDYPKIQYKRVGKNAMIVCLNEGTEAIGNLFAKENFFFNIDGKEMKMVVDKISANQPIVQIWDTMFTYQISNWLALNKENYAKWLLLEGIAEQAQFLEKILIGNILSFCKGVDIRLEEMLKCKVLETTSTRIIHYKQTPLMSFYITFKSNISLPDYIGLGKGASTGFGVVREIKELRN